MIGCDGIFDQLTDIEIIDAIWNSLKDDTLRKNNIHLQCGVIVELILKASLARKSLDNVTCILICFNNFEKKYNMPTSNSKLSLNNIANQIQLANNNFNNVRKVKDNENTYDKNNKNDLRLPSIPNFNILTNNQNFNGNKMNSFTSHRQYTKNLKLSENINSKQNNNLNSISPNSQSTKEIEGYYNLLGTQNTYTPKNLMSYYHKNSTNSSLNLNNYSYSNKISLGNSLKANLYSGSNNI